MNKFLVGAQGMGIVIMNPPRRPMTADEAMELAAWIVSIAQVTATKTFDEVLAEVQS